MATAAADHGARGIGDLWRGGHCVHHLVCGGLVWQASAAGAKPGASAGAHSSTSSINLLSKTPLSLQLGLYYRYNQCC